MSSFVDKEKVKSVISMDQAIKLLDLDLKPSGKQLRGCCPLCNSEDDRSFVITPEKSLWYSFCCQVGGDQIGLWERIRGLDFQDACREMLGTAMAEGSEAGAEELKPLDYLEFEHPSVQCLGFEPDAAETLGIGFAKKGILKGTVAVPVRLVDGRLSGYVGITDARLPKSFRL